MKLNKFLSRYKQLKRLDSLGLNGKNILKVLTDYKKRITNPIWEDIEDNEFFSKLNNSLITLNSSEIIEFIKLTSNYESSKNYHTRTGIYLSDIIQKSYNAGNNDFNIDINYFNNFGYNLNGSIEKPIVINIKENYGLETGINSKSLELNIKKNYGEETGVESDNLMLNIKENYGLYLCSETYNSKINIKKNYAEEVGVNAKSSSFKIRTNYGVNVGADAKKSVFNIKYNHYKSPIGTEAELCVFKSLNRKTLDSVEAEFSFGNKIYLIDLDYNETLYIPRKN
jgi:hypothetical protein